MVVRCRGYSCLTEFDANGREATRCAAGRWENGSTSVLIHIGRTQRRCKVQIQLVVAAIDENPASANTTNQNKRFVIVLLVQRHEVGCVTRPD